MNIRPLGGHLPTQWVGAHWVGDYPPGKVKMGAGVGRTTMSEEHNTDEKSNDNDTSRSINRRRFVESLGAAGGVGLVGSSLIGQASATPNIETNGSESNNISTSKTSVNFGDIRSSPKVQSIVKELNDIRLKPENAESYQLDMKENVITVSNCDTQAGRLRYAEFDDGRTDAHFFFDSDFHKPKGKYHEPTDTEGILVGKENSVVFHRSATEEETSAVANRLGTSQDNLIVYTTSEIDHPRAIVVDKSKKRVEHYDVKENIHTIGIENGKSSQTEGVSTNDICDGTGLFCWLCIEGVAICGACVSICATGVGAGACVLCLVHTCGVTAPDCYTCIDCLS